MGTWGTGIFSSDLASDVRAEWREGIVGGVDPRVLSDRLVADHQDSINDRDVSTAFWTGLAAAQMETGRLDPTVRDKALENIAAGGDLELWQGDESGAPRREQALDELAARLRGPQSKPKKLRGPHIYGTALDIGDVLLLYGRSKKDKALAVVVDHMTVRSKQDIHPVIQYLLWDGKHLPPSEKIIKLPSLYAARSTKDLLNKRRLKLRHGVWVMMTVKKTDAFGPDVGEVILKGVDYRPAGDVGAGALYGGDVVTNHATWSHAADYISGQEYAEDVSVTIREHGKFKHRVLRIFK